MKSRPPETAADNNASPRLSLRRIAARGWAAVMLYLGASPLFVLAGAAILPQLMAAALMLPAAALLLTFLAALLPPKRRRPGFLAAVLLEGTLCFFVLQPAGLLALPLFLCCLFMMLLFMPAMARAPYLEWAASQISAGVLLHLLAQAVKGMELFAGAGPLLSLFFTAYLLLCLFAFNRFTLLGGTREEQAPPGPLLSKNRKLLFLLCLIALPAANLPAVKAAALAVFHWVKNLLFTLVSFLSSLFPQFYSVEQGAGGPSGMDLGFLGESSPPSALALILEKILVAIGLLLAGLLALFLGYRLLQLLKRGVKALLRRLKAYSLRIGEEYEDKTENLFQWGDMGRAAKEKWARFQSRRRNVPWEKLTPREKVRQVYALLLSRLKNDTPALTAREALLGGHLCVAPEEAEKMACLYEQARYSGHDISMEEANAMRKNAGI